MLVRITAILILPLAVYGVSAGAQCRIVRIYDRVSPDSASGATIEPQTIMIAKGSCVIWVSLGNAQMMVNFREGRRCFDTTEAATGFSLSDACFVTSWVPSGGTSGLTFTEAGTYVYEIE